MTSQGTRILERLQQWADKEGKLPDYLELYRELLSAQASLKAKLKQHALPPEEVTTQRLEADTPMLKFEEIGVDWKQFASLLKKTGDILAKHELIKKDEQRALKAMVNDTAFLKSATQAFYDGHTPPQKDYSHLSDESLDTMLHIALWPFLSKCAEALAPCIRHDRWARNICPACGGKPDFGFLEKEVGAKWLLCSRCDTQWAFRRIECPFCGNWDAHTLSYMASDNGLHRLYLCDRCHTYLKVVDLRRAQSEMLLPLERLTTLDMDRQGQEKGYKPGGHPAAK